MDGVNEKVLVRIAVGVALVSAALIPTVGWHASSASAKHAGEGRGVLEFRYAGRDPFLGELSAIFVAQLGNGSDERIASVDATVETGDKYSLLNAAADGWRCTTLRDTASSCSKTLPPIDGHLGLEFAILVGTASGVCGAATANVRLVLHFASGDQTLTADASAPSTCTQTPNGLPATGHRSSFGSETRVTVVAMLVALTLGSSGALLLAIGRRRRVESTSAGQSANHPTRR